MLFDLVVGTPQSAGGSSEIVSRIHRFNVYVDRFTGARTGYCGFFGCVLPDQTAVCGWDGRRHADGVAPVVHDGARERWLKRGGSRFRAQSRETTPDPFLHMTIHRDGHGVVI